MEEGLFAQFNKIANSILHSNSKEQKILDGQSDKNTKQIPENDCEVKTKCCKPGGCLLESVSPALKVKALQVERHSPFSLSSHKMLNSTVWSVVLVLAACVMENTRNRIICKWQMKCKQLNRFE